MNSSCIDGILLGCQITYNSQTTGGIRILNLNIDDLVSDERLQEDTDQPHQP